MPQPSPESVAACLTLSPLEAAILRHVGAGSTNGAIAKKLGKSQTAVVAAVSRIRVKIADRFPNADPPSRVELAMIAYAIHQSRQPAVQQQTVG